MEVSNESGRSCNYQILQLEAKIAELEAIISELEKKNEKLEKDSFKLLCLECWGVDNWSGYSDAMQDAENGEITA